MPLLVPFLNGAASALALVSALFFVRFWRRTGDRFFAFFALAFAVMSVNWFALGLVPPDYEIRPFFFLARAAAFLLIIVAIVDKNRAGGAGD